VATSVNKIRNANFAEGKAGPSRWVWRTSDVAATWRRLSDRPEPSAIGMEIASDTDQGNAWWSQTVGCARDKYVRVDAVVTCALSPGDDTGGFVLSVQALEHDEPVGQPRFAPAIRKASDPITVRTYLKLPENAKRLCVSVGVVRASGVAVVHEVRVMPLIEPEEASHILAIPPPAYAVPPTRLTRRVVVCSETADTRPLTQRLREALGTKTIKTVAPQAFDPTAPAGDAVLLFDEKPPRRIRSLKALCTLADERIVVISLPALVALSKDALTVKRVEQEDDPLCARVAFAGSMTRGFALDDVFTFAWEGTLPGSYTHHQLAKTTAFKVFAKRHGFETLLSSVGNQDVTTGRPLALYKPSDKGGLFVLDMEPAESTPTTMNEPVLPLHLLLNILGHADTGLGQYIVPAPNETILRDLFREAYPRFREFIVHDADAPSSEVTEQLVTIGRDDESFGLPLKEKPLILVRSGLVSGDAESVYGSFLWFKQLIRMAPYTCPYAPALSSRYRLAWVPCMAPWAPCHGWRRSGAPPRAPLELAIEDGGLSAVIDIVSRGVNQLRVVLPKRSGFFDRFAEWFPRLTATFGSDRFFAPCAPAGGGHSDRDAFAWRYMNHDVEVLHDPDAFQEGALRDAVEAGAAVMRIEVPGGDADFPATSIHRTHVVATALEHAIGLHYGLMAVNRHLRTVHFDGFAPLAPGESLIVDGDDRVLSTAGAQAG